ncbi:MAG: glycerol-3-phosphate 1-O-acyltransferase PlsY [Candidatus Cloacimonas sp.]|jgi:glycerol-3-phosphate acyltransferase PlsY|nr:glycerol-3-phosphate 1-O-acyltransferase PlsY [Candidatus Cloacimonadota bacterium]
MNIQAIFIGLIAYVMGSIPFSYLYGKIFHKIDLREHGSGNVGSTNALRVLGWRLGLLTLISDMLKGFLAVWLVKRYFGDCSLIIPSLAVILGHTFTIFLKFKGGKGVATSAGVFAALIPLPFILALSVFIIVTALSKYVSLGSITAALTLSIAQLVVFLTKGYSDPVYLILAILVTTLIIVKHRENIGRLMKGTENKISFKSKS